MVEGSATDGLVVLVVDDEAPARNELAWVLDQDPRVSRVLAAPSGTAALAALEHEPVDVVFSDISMPGLDGMQLARVIKRFTDPPAVVFVTAHDRHAVDAFDLERAERGAPEEDETIPVELGGVTRFVSRNDIRYVQAHGDYARLHTARGSHLVRIPLANLEERWHDAGFVRIHRSTIVSTRHISEVRMDQGRCTVVVDGDVELQVSRRHTRALRSTLLRLGDKP